MQPADDTESTQLHASFSRVVLRVHELACHDICPADKTERRAMYLQFRVEPGNVSVVSAIFSSNEDFPVEAEIEAPPSLLIDNASSTELSIELYCIRSEGHHEMICSCITTIASLRSPVSGPKEMHLHHKHRSKRMSVLRMDMEVLPCLEQQPIDFDALSSITIVALDINGFEKEAEPVIFVKMLRDTDTVAYCSDIGVGFGETHVWNHRWTFELNPSQLNVAMINFSVCDSAAIERVVATTTVNVTELKAQTKAGLCELRLPLTSPNEVSDSLQSARIAWSWTTSPIERNLNSQGREFSVGNSCEKELVTSNIVKSPTLASQIRFVLHSLCQLNTHAAKRMEKSIAQSKEQHNEALCIQLQLHLGRDLKTVDASIPTRYISLVTDHCTNEKCVVFNREASILRIPMQPEWPEALNSREQSDSFPRAFVKINSSSSKAWCLVSEFSIRQPILLAWTSPIAWQFSVLDQEDRNAGLLCVGLDCSTESNDLPANASIHSRRPYSAVFQLKRLSSLVPQNKSTSGSLSVRLWSSSKGPQHLAAISGLSWMGGDDDNQGSSCALSLFDIESDVIHVDLFNVHANSRREFLGSGTFQCNLPVAASKSELCPAQSEIDTTATVNLFSTSKGNQSIELGNAIFLVKLKSTNGDIVQNPATIIASPAFRDPSTAVAYCEGRSWLNVYVEKCNLPQEVSKAYGAVQVEFRLTSKPTWTVATKWIKPSSGSPAIVFSEMWSTQNHWSSKDRCIPMLQARIKVRERHVLDSTGLVNAFATQNRGGKKNISTSKAELKREVSTTDVLGDYLLDLSNFYTRAGVWTRFSIPIRLKHSTPTRQEATVPVTLHVLISDTNIQGRNPSLEQVPSSVASETISGDICLHLKQASGAFLNSEFAFYFVELSTYCGMSARSRLTRSNQGRMISWNEYLSVSVMFDAAPVMELAIYKCEMPGYFPNSCENPIAVARFPMLSVITAKQHLMRLDIPLTEPTTLTSFDRSGSECLTEVRKIGVVSVDVQFVPNESAIPTSEKLLLIIQELRGDLLAPLSSFIVLKIYATRDSGDGKAQRTGISTKLIVSLTKIGETITVNESVDMNLLELTNAGNQVIIIEVCDINEKVLSVCHIPLRVGWKKKMFATFSKPRWYKLIRTPQSSSGIEETEEGFVLVGFCQESALPLKCSLVETTSSVFLQLIKVVAGTKFNLAERKGENIVYIEVESRRTRKVIWNTNSHTCQWSDEWIPLPQAQKEPLTIKLILESSSRSIYFTGESFIASIPVTQGCTSRNEWVTLSRPTDAELDHPQKIYLQIRAVSLPPVAGTIELCVRNFEMIDEAVITNQGNECMYLACTQQNKTAIAKLTRGTEDYFSHAHVILRNTVNTTAGGSVQSPMLLLRWMVHSDIYGDICAGCCSIDLLVCMQVNESSASMWRWVEFRDRIDQSKVVAVCEVSTVFLSVPNYDCPIASGRSQMTSNNHLFGRTETLAIWKKLFYMLDKDGNEVVDLDEFTNLFTALLAEMMSTSDGSALLALLFSSNDLSVPPTADMIQALFVEMDVGSDKQIQWDEYVAFLRRRQDKHGMSAVNTVADQSKMEAIVQPTTELRRKRREDPKSNVSSPSLPQTADKQEQDSSFRVKSNRLGVEPSLTNKSDIALKAQVDALKLNLEHEKEKYAKLREEWQALQRSYQQLHLKQQKDAIDQQVRAKHIQEAIQRQEELLRAREALKKKQYDASVVLQSTLRLRLEQRRYQGIKILRANAALTLQCFYRQKQAQLILTQLKLEGITRRTRVQAAVRIQRFVRCNLCRKRRQLFIEARNLSSLIIQKHTRGELARRAWTSKRRALIVIQTWCRRHLALLRVSQLRQAVAFIRWFVRGWVLKRRYSATRVCVTKIAQWWRSVRSWRIKHFERMEAAICIQASWRSKLTRIRLQRTPRDFNDKEMSAQVARTSGVVGTVVAAGVNPSLPFEEQHEGSKSFEATSCAVSTESSGQQIFTEVDADEASPTLEERSLVILNDAEDVEHPAIIRFGVPDLPIAVQRVVEDMLRFVEDEASASKQLKYSRPNENMCHEAPLSVVYSPTTSPILPIANSESTPNSIAAQLQIRGPEIPTIENVGCEDFDQTINELIEVESALASILTHVVAFAASESISTTSTVCCAESDDTAADRSHRVDDSSFGSSLEASTLDRPLLSSLNCDLLEQDLAEADTRSATILRDDLRDAETHDN